MYNKTLMSRAFHLSDISKAAKMFAEYNSNIIDCISFNSEFMVNIYFQNININLVQLYGEKDILTAKVVTSENIDWGISELKINTDEGEFEYIFEFEIETRIRQSNVIFILDYIEGILSCAKETKL